ncbi:RNA polymerase sigma-70 factor [Aurantibacillus circumpalustris]|uniref:RNA polymerase sigma-70 factor n=1 Tax=Aurantibacillus circumpalustris TaxID=3036359 RepID=UPI00295BBB21|nr:RNA polymerase sigma-70 factor [Aurantibacillus circumpalustris]
MKIRKKVQLNEQEYWQNVSRGDKKAFEQLFNTHYQPLCNYAYSLLKDIDEAEEVVQNTFFNVWSKRETLQITTSFKSYIYRAVHNDSLNKIKHGKVKASYATDYKSSMSGGFDSSSQILEAKELGKQINEAIASLPEQCGNVFKLSRFENLKYSEIAEQLEISVKTVENHMGKALKILRSQLKDYLPLVAWLFFIN